MTHELAMKQYSDEEKRKKKIIILKLVAEEEEDPLSEEELGDEDMVLVIKNFRRFMDKGK